MKVKCSMGCYTLEIRLFVFIYLVILQDSQKIKINYKFQNIIQYMLKKAKLLLLKILFVKCKFFGMIFSHNYH